IALIATVSVVFNSCSAQTCPVPLYSDPVYKGAADPEVVWNEHEQEWWIFYTARRSVCEKCPLPALAIGVAASKDWLEWRHVGYIKVDDIGGTSDGPDILWAPGIIRDGDTYHMFLTFKKGDGDGKRWGMPESLLLHLKAPKEDLLNGWQSKGIVNVPFSSIDATLVKKDSTWNLFHRDIIKGQKSVNTFRATTNDLNKQHNEWNYLGAANGDINDKSVNGYNYQEAQFAFYWKGFFWMMTDPSNPDIPVYKSKDLEYWTLNNVILNKDGKAEHQKGQVRHPGVVVLGDRAFIFYFNQPYKEDKNHPEKEHCFVNISELKYENGKITCDRNALVTPPQNLIPKDGEWGQKAE
ncbi:MAG: hypothetical protein MI922_10060, partial [Bacteroidales bacterium]|nr:hypothetical protein [Bacteroidales bacterium]